MGALRKTLVYLGLAEDAYDDAGVDRYYDGGEDEGDDGREHHRDDRREAVPEQRVDSRRDGRPEQRHEQRGATVTHLPSAVRAAGELQRITAVHPRTYNDAKVIGEHFREGVPVIMNLTDMTDVEAKRLVDFAAGLVFGLHGAVERVTNKVFLLSPSAVEVTNEKHEAAPTAAFFNQS